MTERLRWVQPAITSHRTPSAGTLALPLWGDSQVLLPLERIFGPHHRRSPSEVTQLLPGVRHLWGSPQPLLGLLLRDSRAAEPQLLGSAVCPASQEPWPMGQ